MKVGECYPDNNRSTPKYPAFTIIVLKLEIADNRERKITTTHKKTKSVEQGKKLFSVFYKLRFMKQDGACFQCVTTKHVKAILRKIEKGFFLDKFCDFLRDTEMFCDVKCSKP